MQQRRITVHISNKNTIEQMRIAYEARRTVTPRLNTEFTKLFELFQSGMSTEEMARELQTSTSTVRRIKRKFFSPITERQKQKLAKRKSQQRSKEVRKRSRHIFEKRVLTLLQQLTNANALDVHPYHTTTSCARTHARFLVNGKCCIVRFATRNLKIRHHRSYMQVVVKKEFLETADFLIVIDDKHTDDTCAFVIPTRQLLTHIFNNIESSGYRSIYLPTQTLPIYNEIKPRIDYLTYRDAWQQLVSVS